MGYEAYRELVFERQKKLGIVPEQAELSPINPYTDEHERRRRARGGPSSTRVRPWDSLSDDEKRLFSRMAEVYAGFLSHADHEIGRLLDYLEEQRPAREHDDRARLRQRRLGRGRPERLGQREQALQRRPGHRSRRTSSTSTSSAAPRPTTTTRPAGRARSTRRSSCGSATRNWEGGTADPMIVSWPAQIKQTGVRRQYTHAVDIVPTIYECLGVEPPESRQGLHPVPDRGRQLRRDVRRRRRQDRQADAVLLDGRHPRDLAPGLEGGSGDARRRPDMWADYATQRWELFDTDERPERVPRPRRPSIPRSCRS